MSLQIAGEMRFVGIEPTGIQKRGAVIAPTARNANVPRSILAHAAPSDHPHRCAISVPANAPRFMYSKAGGKTR